MDALIEWLRVQLVQDVATADVFHHQFCDLNADDYIPGKTICSCGEPKRRLAEVKAKRAILDHYEEWQAKHHSGAYHQSGLILLALTTQLRLLADPYAGRDGWQTEWALTPEP